jgi:fucose permease
MLSIITAVSCLLGFFPNNYLIAIIGVKTGLLWGFGIAIVGASLTLFLDKSYYVFLIGFVIKHMALPSFHCSKRVFTNTFFKEKDKPKVFSLIMLCFPLGVGLSSLVLNKLTKGVLGKDRIIHIF